MPCLHQNGSVHVSSVRVRFAGAREGTPERDVHGELSSPETGQVLCEHLNAPVTPTPMFMSRMNTLNLTLAPASRQTLARTRSMGMARFLSLPVLGHAALCLPNTSKGPWQPLHLVSSIWSGSCILSNSNVLNRCEGITYSGAVGAWASAAPALCPEWERRCERTDSIWVFLKNASEMEEAQYCQPCCHSPGSPILFCGGRFPWRSSGHDGLHQKPSLSSRLDASLAAVHPPWPARPSLRLGAFSP